MADISSRQRCRIKADAYADVAVKALDASDKRATAVAAIAAQLSTAYATMALDDGRVGTPHLNTGPR